jgi:hypothetical protein
LEVIQLIIVQYQPSQHVLRLEKIIRKKPDFVQRQISTQTKVCARVNIIKIIFVKRLSLTVSAIVLSCAKNVLGCERCCCSANPFLNSKQTEIKIMMNESECLTCLSHYAVVMRLLLTSSRDSCTLRMYLCHQGLCGLSPNSW